MSKSSKKFATSILMAVHNGDNYLQETLDSLAEQTCKDFLLVVIDDCSTDRTADILAAEKRISLLLLRNDTNQGLTKSLNRGLEHCETEWIMRMDADDICEPDRVSSQLAFANQNPELVLFSSSMTIINAYGKTTGHYSLPLCDAQIRFSFLFGNPFAHPSVCFKRKALLDAGGGYNCDFTTCQDYELWSRLMTLGRVANQKTALVRYRRHPNTINALRASEQQQAITKIRSDYFRSECRKAGAVTDKEIEAALSYLLGGTTGDFSARDSLTLTQELLLKIAKSQGLKRKDLIFYTKWFEICKREKNLSKLERLWWATQRGKCGFANVLHLLSTRLLHRQ